MDNYFIIGDIHGEIQLLDKLLKEIEPFHPDKLVFVGDYIDRGPHSKMVVDRIMDLGSKAVCLLGNHELMLLNAIENTAFGYSPIELWYYNGAEATLQSFGSNSFFSFQSDLDGRYLDFFRNLRMNHIVSLNNGINFMVTHAGVSPAIPFSDQVEMRSYKDLHNYILKKHLEPGEAFIWVRDDFFNATPSLWEDYIIVHGHTPVNKLKRFIQIDYNGEWQFYNGDLCIRRGVSSDRPVSIDIDSGSTISGRLTALGIFIVDNQVRIQSITVSSEEIVKRDLGKI